MRMKATSSPNSEGKNCPRTEDGRYWGCTIRRRCWRLKGDFLVMPSLKTLRMVPEALTGIGVMYTSTIVILLASVVPW